jgi:hypothetical protein
MVVKEPASQPQLWYLKQIRKADGHLEKYVNQLWPPAAWK